MAMRPVKSINLGDLEPNVVSARAPGFELVEPSSLLIDGAYQRALSENSIKLIRKIVVGWDWARFKPPVVAQTAEGLEVIDGQHTAIAAASHPGVSQIPVMIVEAAEQADRAMAFVGHNRDRLQITPMQMHFAAVAAGDDDAVTVQQVCARAGITVLRVPPSNGFKARDTVAVKSIAALCNRRSALGARKVLQVLADANCAPVSAAGIKAVEVLLHDPEYSGQIDGPGITTALIALGQMADQEARVFAAAHSVPQWKALAVVLFKRGRHGRRRAA